MVSLLPTKFHEILFSSFRGVALTNCVTDRTKTTSLPTKVGGDIIGLVVSEEKIFEKVYDVRRTPSDGNSSYGPLGQVS